MRIGTWNIAGRWSEHHQNFLTRADCDVWLLTEVNECTHLPGHTLHLSQSRMAPQRRWAGIASRLPMAATPDPHPASAQAQVGGSTYVSSVLPWRSCGSAPPWVGDRHVDKTENAVGDLMTALTSIKPLVWGGDWNHALTGKEYAGSIGGRRAVVAALSAPQARGTSQHRSRGGACWAAVLRIARRGSAQRQAAVRPRCIRRRGKAVSKASSRQVRMGLGWASAGQDNLLSDRLHARGPLDRLGRIRRGH